MIKISTIPRLLEAAKEFNIGRATIVEFLWENGFEINGDQNEKLSEDMYNAVQIKFGIDKQVKLESEEIILSQDSLLDILEKLRDEQNMLANPKKLENQRKLEKQKINLEKQRNKKLKDKEQPDFIFSQTLSRKRIILQPPQPKLLPSPFNEDELVHFSTNPI